MSVDEIRRCTQSVCDSYYRLSEIWKRAKCTESLKARVAFVFVSKLYRQLYADTGIATDSARQPLDAMDRLYLPEAVSGEAITPLADSGSS